MRLILLARYYFEKKIKGKTQFCLIFKSENIRAIVKSFMINNLYDCTNTKVF